MNYVDFLSIVSHHDPEVYNSILDLTEKLKDFDWFYRVECVPDGLLVIGKDENVFGIKQFQKFKVFGKTI